MLHVYAMFDNCSGTFGDPVVCYNDKVAIRIFDNSVSDRSIPDYVRHDVVLYHLGMYDQQTGALVADGAPYIIARGCNVVVPRPEEEVITDAE